MGIESAASPEEAVELVTPPSANTPWLLRFMAQLEEILRHDDSRGSILSTVGSRDCSTVITVLLESTQVSNLVIKLAFIPDVEKVEEGPLATGAFSSFADRLRVLLTSNINTSKRLYLTLEETDVARQEQHSHVEQG